MNMCRKIAKSAFEKQIAGMHVWSANSKCVVGQAGNKCVYGMGI
jgi:hypothetical protein